MPVHLLPTGVVLGSAQTVAQLSIPLIVAGIVDDALLAGDGDRLVWLCLGLVAVAVVLNVCRVGQDLLYRHAAQRAVDALQLAVAGHLLTCRMSDLDRARAGSLHSHLAEDVPQAVRRIEPITRVAVQNGLLLVGLLALLAWKYGWIALIALVLVPLYVAFPLFVSRRLRLASSELLEARSEANALFQETFQASRDFKILGQERWAVDRLRPYVEKRLRRFMRTTSLNSLQSISSLFYFLVAAVVYRVGGARVLDGQMTVGGLVALVSLLAMLESPVAQLTSLTGPWQSSRAALERLETVLSQPVEVQRVEALPVEPRGEPSVSPLGASPRMIRFEEVSFGYGEADEPAVEGVSFTVEPGWKVALVGPSGAGKTTLAYLLLRLYEPTGGRITLAGHDLREIPLPVLRREVGLVQQDPVLLSGSLWDNLRLGRLEASDEEIRQAARVANADGFIRALPQGYDTRVGERGVGLSGGQRQRIAVARTVLRNPRILVLDEATSALDAESDRAVREAIGRVMMGRTSLVIAHRLSWVADADLILVLDQGRLAARGRHDQLLASCPLYRRLCELQWGSARAARTA